MRAYYYRRKRRLRKTTELFRKRFAKSSITYRWNKAYEKTGVKLTPDRLRDWFCNEMATLGVADHTEHSCEGTAREGVVW